MRLRAFSATLISFTITAALAVPALASAFTGGTASGASVSSSSPTSTPATPHAPVSARSSSIAYTGPVYEKNAVGQVVPYVPPAPVGQTAPATGGIPVSVSTSTKPDLLVPGTTARIVDGLAAAPISAPAAVQQIIWTGNQIIGLPYIYGGGHASFSSPGYDCSGTVSFALHGATLISTPMDSSEYMHWGSNGTGQWVTVFSNPEHAYMTVAGIRLDTSAADDPSNQQGPRWRPLRHGNVGYKVRHPLGL